MDNKLRYTTKPIDSKVSMTKRDSEAAIVKYLLSNHPNMQFSGFKAEYIRAFESVSASLQGEYHGVGTYLVQVEVMMRYCEDANETDPKVGQTKAVYFQSLVNIGENVNHEPVVKSIEQPINLIRK
jgi:hypothetical protein